MNRQFTKGNIYAIFAMHRVSHLQLAGWLATSMLGILARWSCIGNHNTR